MQQAEIEIPENIKEEVNKYLIFSTYIYTWIANKFMNCPMDILALFFGNQTGKGALIMINYILRILGHHPVPRKNVLYYECKNKHYYSPANIVDMKFGTDPFTELYSKKYVCPKCKEPLNPHIREGSHRIIRFASQNMPGSEATTMGKGKREESIGIGETKNTQYIELMKWLPPHLLRDKKISVRDATQRIIDPFPTGMDIIIEYLSYNQVVQAGAGHQRLSTNCSELPSKDFFDEQIPRLLAVPGADLILDYTVTKEVGYLFDLIWSRARKIYRSKSIVDFFREKRKEILPREEETDSEFKNIAVFHASTYDNPTLEHDRIDEMMMLLHDECADNEDVMEMRKYCIFSEISSVIFPTFNMRTHSIDPNRWFKDGQVCMN